MNIRICFAATVMVVCTTVAWAEPPKRTVSKAELGQALAAHKDSVAKCRSGQTNQSRTDCLREADNALQTARLGGHDDAGASHASNRRLRCAPLPEDQRADCMARMSGAGTTSGSAATGGIIRELVTPVPAASAPR